MLPNPSRAGVVGDGVGTENDTVDNLAPIPDDIPTDPIPELPADAPVPLDFGAEDVAPMPGDR